MNFQNHFKDLFHATTDLIQFVSTNTSIELVNTSWLHLLEYELYEVVGRSIYDFVDPEYMDFFKASREKSIASKTSEIIETVFISKSGARIFVEGNITFFSDGDLPYTRAVFKNITEKYVSEKRLEENEKRLDIIFKRAPDAIIIINEYQKIIEWNPKAETIFGFMASEVIGKTLSETIIPLQYREAHIRGMAHFLKTGEGPVLNKTIEITALHKNKNEFYIDLSISSVQMNGEWMFIAFISDISERKKTEEALIFKEAQLLQAKLLEEKKDEFISTASHELKTPLTTIKAYAQIALMSDEIVPEKIIQYIQKIDQYTYKLAKLINELLDVSKINAGKLELMTLPDDLHVFLRDTINSIQHITTHEIHLQQNVSVKVNIDTLRLEQVIVNIISNAAKYSPGKNEIIVNSRIQDDMAVISFTDFGIGIAKENADKIFTRFYRVNEDANQFSGLGIGLYISSEIIKQHGGKIWVESEPGKGSTFYFNLPVLQEKQ